MATFHESEYVGARFEFMEPHASSAAVDEVPLDEGFLVDLDDADISVEVDAPVLGFDLASEPKAEATIEKATNDDPNILRGEMADMLNLEFADGASWKDILLGIVEKAAGSTVRREIEQLSRTCEDCDTSIEPLDDFLQRDVDSSWASHDPRVDRLWEEFIVKIEALDPSLDVSLLSKPSGPLNAALTCLWAYPTFTTTKPQYGSTMDRSNPCLFLQHRKLGSNNRVRTQDRFPIRESFDRNGVTWEKRYTNWEAIEPICLELNQQLNKHSKFLILLGSENHLIAEKLIYLDDNIYIRRYDGLPGNVTNISTHRAFPFWIIRHSSGRIIQVVWFCAHLQYLFYLSQRTTARYYHDLLWNGLCELCGITITKEFSFAMISGRSANDPSVFRGLVSIAIEMRHKEKTSGELYPEETVRKTFREWIEKDPLIANQPLQRDDSGSFIRPIFRRKRSQSTAKLHKHNRELREAGLWTYSKLAMDTFAKNREEYQAGYLQRAKIGALNESDKRMVASRNKGLAKGRVTRITKTQKKAKAILSLPESVALVGKDPNILTSREKVRVRILKGLLDAIERNEAFPDPLRKFMRRHYPLYDPHKRPDGLRVTDSDD